MTEFLSLGELFSTEHKTKSTEITATLLYISNSKWGMTGQSTTKKVAQVIDFHLMHYNNLKLTITLSKKKHSNYDTFIRSILDVKVNWPVI